MIEMSNITSILIDVNIYRAGSVYNWSVQANTSNEVYVSYFKIPLEQMELGDTLRLLKSWGKLRIVPGFAQASYTVKIEYPVQISSCMDFIESRLIALKLSTGSDWSLVVADTKLL